MARIRTVKPGFFTDEELSELPAETHLFGGGLLCQADDQGYFKATPGILEGAIYPIRECSLSVHEMLRQLAVVRFIRLGTGKDGKRYGQVVTFDEHQRVNRPSPSKISKLQIVWDGEGETHTQLTESSPTEGKGIRKGNKEKKQTPSVAVAPVDERKAAIREAIKKAMRGETKNASVPGVLRRKRFSSGYWRKFLEAIRLSFLSSAYATSLRATKRTVRRRVSG